MFNQQFWAPMMQRLQAQRAQGGQGMQQGRPMWGQPQGMPGRGEGQPQGMPGQAPFGQAPRPMPWGQQGQQWAPPQRGGDMDRDGDGPGIRPQPGAQQLGMPQQRMAINPAFAQNLAAQQGMQQNANANAMAAQQNTMANDNMNEELARRQAQGIR